MAAIFFNLMLTLDSIVYNLIDYLYDIFYFLAGINIFSSEDYNFIVGRIYVILGLVMLFVLTYSLLKAVIDPETFAKGENSFGNIVKNVVVSLIIIIALPVVFDVAFNIQNTFLNNNVIPKLILGENYESKISGDAGREISYNVYYAFFHEDEAWCTEENSYDIESGECASNIAGNGSLGVQNGEDLKTVREKVENGAGFKEFNNFGEAVEAGQISYMFLISTIAGLFIAYVLLNFCFDLGIRVVKLAFYQIIAPIPVVCRILPGGKMKDVFSKWVKQVISIFVEVFIRIAVIFLGVFIITLIVSKKDSIPGISALGLDKQCIIIALLIMGVIAFVRQAPKLLGDILNLDTGGMKLGLMDKLAMGGGLVAGAAVGGLATTGLRNLVAGGRNTKRNFINARKNGKLGVGAIVGGSVGTLTSMVAGAGSGMLRAGYGAKNAKNLKDMSGATNKAVVEAINAKAKRDSYKANRRININENQLGVVGKIPVIGGLAAGAVSGVASAGNTLLGHGEDAVRNVGQFLGINNMQALIDENKTLDEITSKRDAIKNAAQDLVLGEAKKNKNKSFGISTSKLFTDTSNLGRQYSNFNTKNLRDLQQKMEIAKQTGFAKDAFGVDVSAQEWEDLYGKYLSEFTDEVQNQALQSTENFNNMIKNSGDALGMQADFSALQSAVSDFRRVIKDNSLNSAVVSAGLTVDMVNGDKDLKVKDAALDNLGKTLKIEKTKNIQQLNELRQKQENSSNKKS